MKNAIIEARDVCFQYEDASALAVDHLNIKKRGIKFRCRKVRR